MKEQEFILDGEKLVISIVDDADIDANKEELDSLEKTVEIDRNEIMEEETKN